MPSPKIKIPQIHGPTPQNLRIYSASGVISLIIITGLVVFFGWQAQDRIKYPRITTSQAVQNISELKDHHIALQGGFVDFRQIPKPLCITQGGNKTYPEVKSGYHYYPALWGLGEADSFVAVKIVTLEGQEILQVPEYEFAKPLQLKGKFRVTTTRDDCNLDVVYPSGYLEIDPEQVGIKEAKP